MIAHVHNWIADRTRNRFTCGCGVVGHAPSIMGGQHRAADASVIAYRCRRRVDGKNCSAEAVHVTGDCQASRCAEHAPLQHQVSA